MNIKPQDPILVSISETSRIINLGKTKTYELIAGDDLETVKIGSRHLVTMESIRRLVVKLLAEANQNPSSVQLRKRGITKNLEPNQSRLR